MANQHTPPTVAYHDLAAGESTAGRVNAD